MSTDELNALWERLQELLAELQPGPPRGRTDLVHELRLQLARQGWAPGVELPDWTPFKEFYAWLQAAAEPLEDEAALLLLQTAVALFEREAAGRNRSAVFHPVPAHERTAALWTTAVLARYNPWRVPLVLQGLRELYAERDARARFSPQTGLVQSLRGDLYQAADLSQDGLLAAADGFARRYERALLGAEGNRWRPLPQRVAPQVVYLEQTDVSGMSLYGGVSAYGFVARDPDNGRLTYVNNNWHPLPLDVDFSRQLQLTEDAARAKAIEFVEEVLRSGANDSEKEYVAEKLHIRTAPRAVIFPLYTPVGVDGRHYPLRQLGLRQVRELQRYTAAWLIFVGVAETDLWQVVVDGEDVENPRPLVLARAVSEAVDVHAHNVDALNSVVQTAVLNAPPGGGAAFMLNVANTAAPALQPQNQPPDLTGLPFRRGNVYYHLHRALATFDDLATSAWPASPPPADLVPGKGQDFPVELDNNPTRFDHSGKIWIGTNDSSPGVHDPARDCEVLYHEYSHAVFSRAQPDLQLYRAASRFNAALDEGLAFYFACALSQRLSPGTADAVYGEFAHRGNYRAAHALEVPQNNWQPDHDFLAVHGIFPEFEGGVHYPNDNKEYALGMLWARTLWQVRAALGADADAIILRAVSLLSGVQSDLVTAAEAIMQVVRDRAQELGIDSTSALDQLRTIFSARGILAEQTVHDVTAFEWDGVNYVVVAVETDGTQTGCFIQIDGNNWQRIGARNVGTVVKVTAVATNTGFTLCAATENYVNNQLESRLHLYDLQKAGGQLDLNKAWRTLGANPLEAGIEVAVGQIIQARVNILSLVLAPQSNVVGRYWVFAGTEAGLLTFQSGWQLNGNTYQGAWAPVPAPVDTGAIFGLSIQSDKLLVACQKGARFCTLNLVNGNLEIETVSALMNGQKSSIENSLASAAAVQAGGGVHLYLCAAVQKAQIVERWHLLHCDGANCAANNVWPAEAVANDRPVYSLLVEAAGGDVQVYAGTDDGVYSFEPGVGNWQAWNTPAVAGQQSPGGTAVLALGRAGEVFWAVTAERGLWRRTRQSGWTPLVAPL